jgi:hypothetical protein
MAALEYGEGTAVTPQTHCFESYMMYGAAGSYGQLALAEMMIMHWLWALTHRHHFVSEVFIVKSSGSRAAVYHDSHSNWSSSVQYVAT